LLNEDRGEKEIRKYGNKEIKLAIFVFYTPFPTFPHGGRSRIQSFPIRWDGKGGSLEYNRSN
jgi:hypothetical protein